MSPRARGPLPPARGPPPPARGPLPPARVAAACASTRTARASTRTASGLHQNGADAESSCGERWSACGARRRHLRRWCAPASTAETSAATEVAGGAVGDGRTARLLVGWGPETAREGRERGRDERMRGRERPGQGLGVAGPRACGANPAGLRWEARFELLSSAWLRRLFSVRRAVPRSADPVYQTTKRGVRRDFLR
jgi:hypothetical protein